VAIRLPLLLGHVRSDHVRFQLEAVLGISSEDKNDRFDAFRFWECPMAANHFSHVRAIARS